MGYLKVGKSYYALSVTRQINTTLSFLEIERFCCKVLNIFLDNGVKMPVKRPDDAIHHGHCCKCISIVSSALWTNPLFTRPSRLSTVASLIRSESLVQRMLMIEMKAGRYSMLILVWVWRQTEWYKRKKLKSQFIFS